MHERHGAATPGRAWVIVRLTLGAAQTVGAPPGARQLQANAQGPSQEGSQDPALDKDERKGWGGQIAAPTAPPGGGGGSGVALDMIR